MPISSAAGSDCRGRVPEPNCPPRARAGLQRWSARSNLWFMNLESVIHSDPEILGGTLVFVGTRVPVRSLFDHLEAGDSIEQFLEGFPSVKREQVIALLEEAREHALYAS